MTSTSTPALPGPRLLADIGGTNARFAWQASADAQIEEPHTLPGAEHATLADALQHYLQRLGRAAPPSCSIAIANPVVGDRVTMTNHHWTFSIAEMKAQLGFQRLLVVNDFTALALALPALPPQDLRQLGGGAVTPDSAIGLIGPGTGLGVSGLLPTGTARGSRCRVRAATSRWPGPRRANAPCWPTSSSATAMPRPSAPCAGRASSTSTRP